VIAMRASRVQRDGRIVQFLRAPALLCIEHECLAPYSRPEKARRAKHGRVRFWAARSVGDLASPNSLRMSPFYQFDPDWSRTK
jgi:hypothetical protein